jgi:hypothetical protein
MRIKSIVLLATILCLEACGSLKVPIGDPERSKVDPALSGIWFISESDSGAMLYVVEPFDRRTWLVWGIEIGRKSKAGDESQSAEGPAMNPAAFFAWLEQGDERFRISPTYKAWITRLGGVRFAVLEQKLQVSADHGLGADGWDVFRLETDGNDTLIVTEVDSSFENLGKVTTSRDAEKIIRKNARNPALYGIDETDKDEDHSIRLQRISLADYEKVRHLLDQGGEISTSRK